MCNVQEFLHDSLQFWPRLNIALKIERNQRGNYQKSFVDKNSEIYV